MLVTRLRLRDFRTYAVADVELGPRITVVHGHNGAGKTNLLEALYLGCTGRSCRTTNERELVRFGAQVTRVELDVTDDDGPHALSVGLEPGVRKEVRVDGIAVPRLIDVPGRPLVRARAIQEVRLLDLSLKGARIEHLDLLHPGVACHLELPPALGSLVLSAQVVWCTIVGRKPSPGGDRRLLSRTGLRFTKLTTTQQTVLAGTLRELAAGRVPA